MSGKGLRSTINGVGRCKAYYDYLREKQIDISKLKNKLDDNNEEILAEWFGDGGWQMKDDIANIEMEDWEIWLDWFPSDDDC